MVFVRLHPGSETALGPALVISIFMASKMPGSKVVLCTDGFANCGVGSLSSGSSEQCEFYERLGETASSLGFVSFLLFLLQTAQTDSNRLLFTMASDSHVSQDFCRAILWKRGLCRHAASVCACVSVCLSRSYIPSKRINISSKFFHHVV